MALALKSLSRLKTNTPTNPPTQHSMVHNFQQLFNHLYKTLPYTKSLSTKDPISPDVYYNYVPPPLPQTKKEGTVSKHTITIPHLSMFLSVDSISEWIFHINIHLYMYNSNAIHN